MRNVRSWALGPQQVSALSNVFTTRWLTYRITWAVRSRGLPDDRYAETGGRLCAM